MLNKHVHCDDDDNDDDDDSSNDKSVITILTSMYVSNKVIKKIYFNSGCDNTRCYVMMMV